MKFLRRRAKRKVNAPGWWTSLHGDALHRNPGWTWYLLPWLAFEPWHPSTLASVPGFCLVQTCSFESGWLWWRVRFTIGHTTRLDAPEKSAESNPV